jgi:hypothetical protein
LASTFYDTLAKPDYVTQDASQHDDMADALSADGSDQPFGEALPRRPRRDYDLFDAHPLPIRNAKPLTSPGDRLIIDSMGD